MADERDISDETNYSSRVYKALPFIVKQWWRAEKSDAPVFRLMSGNWRMHSDPRCDVSDIEQSE